MKYKDFKFVGHKNLEAYCLQAMTYKIMLSGRYEADTYICSPLMILIPIKLKQQIQG